MAESLRRRYQWLGTWVVVLMLMALRWHNWQVLGDNVGYDPAGQYRYLHQVAVEHRWPAPNEGWMDYQPPLYYLVAGPVARGLGWLTPPTLVMAGRATSAVFSLLFLAVAYRFARQMVPSAEPLVVLLLAALPADIVGASMVSSLSLGALLSGVCLVILAVAWQRRRLDVVLEGLLGMAAGLAFLARLENLVMCGLPVALFMARMVTRRVAWRDALLGLALASTVAASCGAIYALPNLARYGRPLISNNDGELFPYYWHDASLNLNLPGSHSQVWFLPSRISLLDPSPARSLWSATYNTLWWDGAHGLLPDNPRLALWLRLVGLVPTLLFLWGAWQAAADPGWGWVVLTPVALVLSLYVAYQIRLPEYSCIKANYCGAAFLPGAILIARACRPWLATFRGCLAVQAGAIAIGLMVMATFWVS